MGSRMHCPVPEPLGWRPLLLIKNGLGVLLWRWSAHLAPPVLSPAPHRSGGGSYLRRIRYSRSSWFSREFQACPFSHKRNTKKQQQRNKKQKKNKKYTHLVLPTLVRSRQHTELAVGLGVRNLNTQGNRLNPRVDKFYDHWLVLCLLYKL